MKLSESDYKSIRLFFKNKKSFRKLTKEQQHLVGALDTPDPLLSLTDMTKSNQIKTRLVQDKVLTDAELDVIEDKRKLDIMIAANRDFMFKDSRVISVDWLQKIDDMYETAKDTYDFVTKDHRYYHIKTI